MISAARDESEKLGWATNLIGASRGRPRSRSSIRRRSWFSLAVGSQLSVCSPASLASFNGLTTLRDRKGRSLRTVIARFELTDLVLAAKQMSPY
jgi:hypothetical protein